MRYCLYSSFHPRVLKEIMFSNVKYVDHKVRMVTVCLFPLVCGDVYITAWQNCS